MHRRITSRKHRTRRDPHLPGEELSWVTTGTFLALQDCPWNTLVDLWRKIVSETDDYQLHLIAPEQCYQPFTKDHSIIFGDQPQFSVYTVGSNVYILNVKYIFRRYILTDYEIMRGLFCL